MSLLAQSASATSAQFHFDLRHGSVDLKGPWEFYWQRFISPSTSAAVRPRPDALQQLPGSWAQLTLKGEKLPSIGYASYRLIITSEPDTHALALRIPRIYSAYRLYLNGALMTQVGEPTTNPAKARPDYGTRVVILPPSNGPMELVLHVSNYWARVGGVSKPIELGTAEAITAAHARYLISEAAVAGALLLLSLFQLVVFFLGRRDWAYLYLGGAILNWGLHVILSAQLLSLAGWHLPLNWAAPLDGWTALASGILLLRFISALFPNDLPHRYTRWTLALLLAYTLAIPLLPDLTRSTLIGWLLYLIVAMICVSLLVTLRVWWRERSDAGLVLLGIALVAITAWLQIYWMNAIGVRGELVNIGILMASVIYSIVLARRYAHAFNRAHRLEHELRRANQFKDELLTNTSHELRTPLHAMIGIAESLHRPGDSELARGLELIARSGHRLARLVDDILAFTRLKYDDLPLEISSHRLEPLIHGVVGTCQSLIGERKLTLRADLESDLPPVLADENRLHQVLFNLVGNAIKFTDEGSITVQARKQGERVRIAVIDTSSGLPPEEWQRLQGPYEQLAESNLEGRGGLGLGLAICRRIVAMHDSELKLKVDGSPGTHIYFDLPVADNDTQRVMDEPRSTPPLLAQSPGNQTEPLQLVQGKSQRILVVDDEEDSALVLEEQLKLAGYQTSRVASGEEALAAIKQSPPDLLMLDVMMPDMSGLTVCRRIREEYDAITLPVILVTARTRPEDAVQGLEAGANDYLAKPFWRQEMLARVAAQLQIHENEQMRWALSEEKARSEGNMLRDPRQVLVALLKKSIQYWELQTGKSRADLAEESRLWTVTLDGSTRKTRTLDRYLDLETLPKRPRWGNVTRTAQFVIARLVSQSQIDELSTLLKQLESALGD